MRRIFETVIEGQIIRIEIDGLEARQRARMTIEQGGTENPAERFLNDWIANTLEHSPARPMPFRDVYAAFCEDVRTKGGIQYSSNRFARELTDRFGKGWTVRHPATGGSVPGALVRFKVQAERDPFAPAKEA